MLYVRNNGWLRWGLPVGLVLLVANHAEPMVRRQLAGASEVVNVSVQAEGSLGHNSIGIDEHSLSGGKFVQFATLGQWDFRRSAQTPCPEPIRQLTGKKLGSVGFMYPLESGERVKTFCLLRSTQTCCYGPQPQFNQYILVESRLPVPFERLTPVFVNGTFFVEPKPDDGYIYRMEADSIRKVDEDLPETDPVTASQKAHLPLFDYQPLVGMAADKSNRTPAERLRALDGKQVVVSGYCVDRTKDNPPRMMVSLEWWDGMFQGKPPTIYNSVVVVPEDADQVPPLWKPHQVFTGTLRVASSPDQWRHEGIVQLQHARLGVPGVTPPFHHLRTTALVPWPLEAAVLALMLFLGLGRRTIGSSSQTSEPTSLEIGSQPGA